MWVGTKMVSNIISVPTATQAVNQLGAHFQLLLLCDSNALHTLLTLLTVEVTGLLVAVSLTLWPFTVPISRP